MGQFVSPHNDDDDDKLVFLHPFQHPLTLILLMNERICAMEHLTEKEEMGQKS